ncbi:RHS repeat-associated core domain-containing protein [Streptomyces sp. WAC 06738]|uniref:RHS repeat-associated core domain-containing protein n=1 Tax=Streptomyces sp. WAC 06738 TaxID=2203210 RepID=UPI001F0C2FE9|nr:RHS repeat-associated core domain-containing protein [Streptomyces sp. WAC 06738]
MSWEYDGLHPLAQSERITGAEAPQDVIDERFFTIVTDLVGSPTELAGEDGSIAWHARSTLWGATTWNRDATAYTPLRFPGQYFDPETQLHYNFHRHYDPDTGRYTTPDPLGLAPAPNPYAYVPNPYTWADPLGLARCTHYADVSVHNPDGSVRVEYSLRSGYQTPQEQALGWPNGAMASHTENRAARMSGGSPTRPIPGDPYANLAPVGPGDSVVLNGTRPPCPQCMGAMNRAAEETGANFVYMWGNGNWWQAGRPLG